MEELREYRTIAEPCTIEQVIKKSKFYGRLYPAESMEQAQEILDGLKKQFWDASHNCSAMIFGQMREFSRCSDDGEPQGTAGMPMLETLRGSGLTNILAVVTRYFGGTLLGTGGLVRAYGSSVSLALQAAKKICYKPRVVFSLKLPFRLWGKAESQLLAAGYEIGEVQYTDVVSGTVFSDFGAEGRLAKLISEISAGKAAPVEIERRYQVIEERSSPGK